MITLRSADITKDAEFLLALRNDPVARANSKNRRKITRKEHIQWLANAKKEGRHLFIAEIFDGKRFVLGYARLQNIPQIVQDKDWRVADVSIALLKEYRYKGYARLLIEAVTKEAKRLKFTVLRAVVRNTNERSLIAFLRSGYTIEYADRGFFTLGMRRVQKRAR